MVEPTIDSRQKRREAYACRPFLHQQPRAPARGVTDFGIPKTVPTHPDGIGGAKAKQRVLDVARLMKELKGKHTVGIKLWLHAPEGLHGAALREALCLPPDTGSGQAQHPEWLKSLKHKGVVIYRGGMTPDDMVEMRRSMYRSGDEETQFGDAFAALEDALIAPADALSVSEWNHGPATRFLVGSEVGPFLKDFEKLYAEGKKGPGAKARRQAATWGNRCQMRTSRLSPSDLRESHE